MGGGLHCPHPVTGTNVLLWEEQRSQLCSRESWTEAFCALRCLNHLSWTFLTAEMSWLQRSPLLSPEAQESTVPKRLPLRPGSRASLPRPCVPVCWSLLPPASSHTCCQLRQDDPEPLSRALARRDTATLGHLLLLWPKGWSDPRHAAGW